MVPGILVSGYAVASALGAIPLRALLRDLPRRRVLCSVLAGFALVERRGRAVAIVLAGITAALGSEA